MLDIYLFHLLKQTVVGKMFLCERHKCILLLSVQQIRKHKIDKYNSGFCKNDYLASFISKCSLLFTVLYV